ncbi:MAG: hypothetical protein Q8P02_00980, partial [Candidatus Micrarchaeota archaeon]|nr:hypothetical protein [Candidatus Micrarchaeota archaeon]
LSGKPNDLSQALGKHYDEFHENMDLGFRKCTGLQSVVLRVGAPPLQLAELKQSFEEAAKRTYRTVGRTGLHSVGAMKSRKKDASVTAYLPGMRPKQKPASASASRVAKRKVPVYLKRRPRRGSDIPGQLRMAFHETA